MEVIMNPNDLLLNKAFIAPLEESEIENIKDNHGVYEGHFAFKHGVQWYFVLESDERGGNRTLTREKLKEAEVLYGDGLITYGELPSLEGTDI